VYLIVARWKISVATRIQVAVSWVVTPCSDVVGYKHFRGPCWLSLQSEWRPQLEYIIIVFHIIKELYFPTFQAVT